MEIKNYLETKQKHNNSKPTGCSKSSSKREIFSNTILSQKTENFQINNLILYLKQPEEEVKTKPKVSTRKEIMKVRAEINKTEMKKTKERIHETKTLFFKKINKIEKPLARLIKKKREKNQFNKIRNEK